MAHRGRWLAALGAIGLPIAGYLMKKKADKEQKKEEKKGFSKSIGGYRVDVNIEKE